MGLQPQIGPAGPEGPTGPSHYDDHDADDHYFCDDDAAADDDDQVHRGLQGPVGLQAQRGTQAPLMMMIMIIILIIMMITIIEMPKEFTNHQQEQTQHSKRPLSTSLLMLSLT